MVWVGSRNVGPPEWAVAGGMVRDAEVEVEVEEEGVSAGRGVMLNLGFGR